MCSHYQPLKDAELLLKKFGDLKRPASLMGEIYDDLMAAVATEPCVMERDQDVVALLEVPHKLRKGMGPR